MKTKQYPVNEFGEPERADGEPWFHYHRRWWFYWSAQEAERRRTVTTSTNRIMIIPRKRMEV